MIPAANTGATGASCTMETASRPGWNARRLVEAGGLTVGMGVNWLLADAVHSTVFSYTSLMLFGWMAVLMIRVQPRAAVLALPLLLTRGATLVSLLFIEAGAYMPELGRTGRAGDASASFVVFTAILFLVYGLVFRGLEGVITRNSRSAMLDRATLFLRWPVILICALLGAIALVQGLQTGFPLIEGIDRFFYRRFLGGGVVLPLLDNKLVIAALLGSIAFSRSADALVRLAAGLTFAGLVGVFFLFGDKFFTIITAAIYFAMPYLLTREGSLLKALLKAWPLATVVGTAAIAATLYIYSDYGASPLNRTVERVGERVAGQGELWFVATQDNRRLLDWDGRLVRNYTAGLDAPDPAQAAFRNGVETYYFVFTYSPEALKRSFKANAGWVQLTMGYEAMGLVMFGYWGLALLMVLGGALVALPALFLLRGFRSEFPLSIAMAMWITLQVYFTVQQASLWTTFARGQLRRFLLAFTIELLLFAFNRGQARGRARDMVGLDRGPGRRALTAS